MSAVNHPTQTLAFFRNELYVSLVMNCSLSIYQVQLFTEPARSNKLYSLHHFLTLVSKGLERGRFAGHDFAQPEPFLAVTFANEPLTYSFNAERRNWIISFLSPDIRPGRLPTLMEIRQDTAHRKQGTGNKQST